MKFYTKISENEIERKIVLLDDLKFQLLLIKNEDVIESYQYSINKIQRYLNNIIVEV